MAGRADSNSRAGPLMSAEHHWLSAEQGSAPGLLLKLLLLQDALEAGALMTGVTGFLVWPHWSQQGCLFHVRCALFAVGKNIDPDGFPRDGTEDLRIVARDRRNDGPSSWTINHRTLWVGRTFRGHLAQPSPQ